MHKDTIRLLPRDDGVPSDLDGVRTRFAAERASLAFLLLILLERGSPRGAIQEPAAAPD